MENATMMPTPRPWRDRAIQRFYGYSEPWPFGEKPSANGICTEVAIVLGWKNRLRVLLGGVVWTKLVIDCENEPGGTSSRSVAFVLRPSSNPKIDDEFKGETI